jgi:hypothetical protein
MFKTMFTALAFITALTGSAHGGQPASLAVIHSIGVISVLGERAQLRPIGAYHGVLLGLSHLKDEKQQPFVSTIGWGLDEAATAAATNALSVHFAVQLAPVDKAPFASIADDPRGDLGKSLGELVRALPPGGPDAYLVLIRSSHDDGPYSGYVHYPDWVSGAGVARTVFQTTSGALLHLPPYQGKGVAYLIYCAYLIDAKTGQIIKADVAHQPGSDALTLETIKSGPMSYPHLSTDDRTWPVEGEPLTGDQEQMLQTDLKRLIAANVPFTLGEMGLADAKPVAADKTR